MFAIVNIKVNNIDLGERENLRPETEGRSWYKTNFRRRPMYSKDDKYSSSEPRLDMKVEATILGHIKDEKVIVLRRRGEKDTKELKATDSNIQKLK
jgi:ribosomal protein L21